MTKKFNLQEVYIYDNKTKLKMLIWKNEAYIPEAHHVLVAIVQTSAPKYR